LRAEFLERLLSQSGRESSVWGSYFGETSLMSGGDPIKAIDL